jgi:hypothetical protein
MKMSTEVCNYISLPSHGLLFCFHFALPYLHQILKRKAPFGYNWVVYIVCEEVSTHTLGVGDDGPSKPPPTSCGMKALI